MTPALESAAEQQAKWSAAASRAKRSIDVWRTATLVLGILGAVLATLATQVSAHSLVRILSIVAAIALALVPVILATKNTASAVKAWTRMRSVSEGVKTEMYLYLTHTPPYGADAEAAPEVTLQQKVAAITGAADDLLGLTAGITPKRKELPAITDVDSYVKLRARQQIDKYYTPKGNQAQHRADLARNCIFGLALLGAALGAVAGALSNASTTVSLSAWVAVVTTVTGAIGAHAAAARYQQNAITYLQTARQLGLIVEEWQTQVPSAAEKAAAGARVVRRCEDVISVENQGWMARWNLGADGP